MTDQSFLTPPQVGRILRVGADQVLGFIRSKELKASNLSRSHRPRWKISPDDLQAFLDRRSNQKPKAPKVKRTRAASQIRQLI